MKDSTAESAKEKDTWLWSRGDREQAPWEPYLLQAHRAQSCMCHMVTARESQDFHQKVISHGDGLSMAHSQSQTHRRKAGVLHKLRGLHTHLQAQLTTLLSSEDGRTPPELHPIRPAQDRPFPIGSSKDSPRLMVLAFLYTHARCPVVTVAFPTSEMRKTLAYRAISPLIMRKVHRMPFST